MIAGEARPGHASRSPVFRGACVSRKLDGPDLSNGKFESRSLGLLRSRKPFTNDSLATGILVVLAAVAAIAFIDKFGVEPARADEIFITNEKDNSVSVIDSKSLEVVRTLRVGQRPRGVISSRDGKTLYVCSSDSNEIQIIDPIDGKRIFELPQIADPEQLVLTADEKLLLTTNEEDNTVTAVDLLTRKIIAEIPVGVEPEGIAISPKGNVAVATSETTNMVHFIKMDGFEVFDNVLVSARPRVAEFSPDGTKLWVTSEVGGVATIIDVATRKIEKEIKFEIQGVGAQHIQPVGLRFTKDGLTAFVALGPANRIAVVDTASGTVKKYILVGSRVWQMILTPDNELLFTTNGGSNDVTVISVATLSPVKSIKVGRQPWGAAVIAR